MGFSEERTVRNEQAESIALFLRNVVKVLPDYTASNLRSVPLVGISLALMRRQSASIKHISIQTTTVTAGPSDAHCATTRLRSLSPGFACSRAKLFCRTLVGLWMDDQTARGHI
jgi:hypothetical protein